MSSDRNIKIVLEDGSEVDLTVEPKLFEVSAEGEMLELAVAYCGKELKDEPEQYLAVTRAWPGKEMVVLSDKDDEADLFSGVVSAVFYKEGKIGLKAVSGDDGEPGALELHVNEDESDPNRLTVSILVDNKGEGEVSIDFGDGTPTGVNPGDGTTSSTHLYAAGAFTVTATDTDQPERTASEGVNVPFPAA